MQAKWNSLSLRGNLATQSISSALLSYMVGAQPPYGGSFLSQELGAAGSQRGRNCQCLSPHTLSLSLTQCPFVLVVPHPSGHGLSCGEAIAREPLPPVGSEPPGPAWSHIQSCQALGWHLGFSGCIWVVPQGPVSPPPPPNGQDLGTREGRMGSHEAHPAHEGLQRELRARSQPQHSLVLSGTGVCVCVLSCSVMSDSMRPHGL